MQELALEAVAAGAAVGGVAGQRVADRGEVGADLVRAPGLQPRLQVALAGRAARAPRNGCGPRARRRRRPPSGGAGARRGRSARRSSRCASRAGRRPAPGRRARPRAPAPPPAAPRGPRRRGRRPAGRWCPCRAGGRSRGAPGPRRRRGCRPARRPASVPSCEGAGWTTRPAGLSTTARASSRWTIAQLRLSHPRAPAPRRAGRSRRAATTPAVIATSARLNGGQEGSSTKSVTSPRRTRSARLPIAPPASSPVATHIPGRAGSRAKR